MDNEKLEEWKKNIYLYEKYVGSEKVSDKKAEELIIKMTNSLYEICQYFIDSSSRQDDFKIRRSSHVFQQMVILPVKVETQITFGFDYRGFYMFNYLSYQYHLKSAGDKFWKPFISLTELGDVEITDLYESQSEFLEEYRKETTYNQSILFNTISSVITQTIENDYIDKFNIEIKFDRNLSFEEIISTAKTAFDRFYKLNYLLYRIDSRKN